VTQMLDYVAVDDVGRVVSPQLVHGQLQGGVVQGWGQVFSEMACYDAQGQLLTGSFMDYAMPRLGCMPALRSELVELPTALNLVGAKGAGEAGCTGSLPALYSAVRDALRPRGITHLDMPYTPARLWAALNPKERGRAQRFRASVVVFLALPRLAGLADLGGVGPGRPMSVRHSASRVRSSSGRRGSRWW